MSSVRTGSVLATAMIIASLMSLSSTAHAADKVRGNIGIGVGRGTGVWGLSGKLYMGDATSIQGVVGVDSNYIGLSGDFLLEMPALVDLGALEIAWALGAGAGVGISDNSLGVAVAGVAGLEFNFNVIPSLPFDLVLEWRPTLSVIPDVGLGLVNFTGHIRIYF